MGTLLFIVAWFAIGFGFATLFGAAVSIDDSSERTTSPDAHLDVFGTTGLWMR
jgi:hypothetical protein